MMKVGGEVSGKGCNKYANGFGKTRGAASLISKVTCENNTFEPKVLSLSVRDEEEFVTVNTCPLTDRQWDIAHGFELRGPPAPFMFSLLRQGGSQPQDERTAQA